MLPNDDAEDILRMTRSRLETYLEEVSPEDLKRSPETRAALFGAMDHVRCHVIPVCSMKCYAHVLEKIRCSCVVASTSVTCCFIVVH